MSLPSYALVSIEEAAEYTKATPEEQPFLERYVAAASSWFEKFTARRLKSQTITEELYDGDGTHFLTPIDWPVNSVTTVEYATNIAPWTWATGDTTNLVIHPRTYQLYWPDYTFPKGTLNIRLTYVAGYTTVPENLKQACLELTLDKWRMSDRQTQGVQTVNLEGQTLSLVIEAVPRSVLEVAKQYQRSVLAGV